MESPANYHHSSLSDEEIIQQWVQQSKNGNEEAFGRLVETFASRLQGMIYRILLDWDETRDIAQETFIHAYRALPNYQHRGRFQSWLFQIGARQALDTLRKKNRRHEFRMKAYGENENGLKEKGVEDTTVNRHEVIAAIEEAVQKLPPEQRTAFVLAEYEGYGYQEIAAVIGGSRKRVEMQLYRARLALRHHLKPFLESL